MDKDHRHCTPIRRLSQLQDKEYLPLKVIKKRIEGGAFTAGDSAEDLSRVLDYPEQQPPRAHPLSGVWRRLGSALSSSTYWTVVYGSTSRG